MQKNTPLIQKKAEKRQKKQMVQIKTRTKIIYLKLTHTVICIKHNLNTK